jgi:two-component system cell cycle sensor histidine kinase/response regulator CckA
VSGLPRGVETILVVDDEPELRRAACRLLERHGYRTLEAASGEEALELARANRGAVDLVFTDLAMPGLGGKALYERLRADGDDVPFLFASGYERDDLEQDDLAAELPFIAKPWTLADLVKRVREALDARA